MVTTVGSCCPSSGDRSLEPSLSTTRWGPSRSGITCGYFAPTGAPDGHDAFFAILILFYELTAGCELQDAVDRVRAYNDELSVWKFWTR